MKKKVLALFLSAALCVTVLPATGMAAEFGSGDAEITEMLRTARKCFPQRKLQSLWERLSSLQKTVRIFLRKWWITLPMQPWKMWKTQKMRRTARMLSAELRKEFQKRVSEEISSEDDPEVLLTELIPEEAGDSMEEENAEAMSSSDPELTVTPTAGPEPTVTPITDPEPTVTPTADPELTVTPTPVPKINVKWTGEKWVSRNSVNVTLKVDANGACYYKAVARKKDGTSDVPRVDTGNSRVAVTANRSFVIYLKNLDTEKEFDLYLKVLGSDGRTSNLKKLKLNYRGTRPKYDVTPTPTYIPSIPDVKE